MGLDLDQADARGRTPLHAAVLSVADARVVARLLAAGSRTEARDDDGATPLQHAVQQAAQLAQLTQRSRWTGGEGDGGDGDGSDGDGDGGLPIVRLLLARGADPDSLAADGVPLLVLAAEVALPTNTYQLTYLPTYILTYLLLACRTRSRRAPPSRCSRPPPTPTWPTARGAPRLRWR